MLPRVTRKGEERVDAFFLTTKASHNILIRRGDNKKESVQSIGLYTDSFFENSLFMYSII